MDDKLKGSLQQFFGIYIYTYIEVNIYIVSQLSQVTKINKENMKPEEMVVTRDSGKCFCYICSIISKYTELNPNMFQVNITFLISDSDNDGRRRKYHISGFEG